MEEGPRVDLLAPEKARTWTLSASRAALSLKSQQQREKGHRPEGRAAWDVAPLASPDSSCSRWVACVASCATDPSVVLGRNGLGGAKSET